MFFSLPVSKKELLIGFGATAFWTGASLLVSPVSTSLLHAAVTTLITGTAVTALYGAAKATAISFGFLEDQYEDRIRADYVQGEEPEEGSPEYYQTYGGYSKSHDMSQEEIDALENDHAETTFKSFTAPTLMSKAFSCLPSGFQGRVSDSVKERFGLEERGVQYTLDPHQEPEAVYSVGGHNLRPRHNH